MDFNKREKVRVKKYLEKLEYFGLTPSRLHKDTKYAKFIGEIESSAIENYKKYKILPSITIAQAILESGWGESDLSKKFNNLFGIKVYSSNEKPTNGEFIALVADKMLIEGA